MTVGECSPYKEYGLELPNGEIHWGAYLNRPIGTEAERAVMVMVLHKTALECGFKEEEFVSRYKWVTRTITPHSKRWAIDDPEVARSLEELQQEPELGEAPAKKPRTRRTSSN